MVVGVPCHGVGCCVVKEYCVVGGTHHVLGCKGVIMGTTDGGVLCGGEYCVAERYHVVVLCCMVVRFHMMVGYHVMAGNHVVVGYHELV